MMRYFVSPDGGFAEVGDGPLAAASIPEGWQEVTAEEYRERQEANRRAAAEAAAEFIAADGDLPPASGVTVPIEELDSRGQEHAGG